jgi:microcystin-dependent protein
MATVTPGKVFTSNEVVTPTNLNALGVPTVSNIVTADLASSTQEYLVPAGAVLPFARSTAPAGWLIANGDSVPNSMGTVQGVTANFSLLYAAVGNSFGSAGKIPDLRGYFVRGSGTNADGAAGAAFGVKQSDAVISHTHTTGNQSQAHTHAIAANVNASSSSAFAFNSNTYLADSYGGLYDGYTLRGTTTTPTLGITGNNSQDHTHTTNSQSPNGEAETRPKNIALLYCIKI